MHCDALLVEAFLVLSDRADCSKSGNGRNGLHGARVPSAAGTRSVLLEPTA